MSKGKRKEAQRRREVGTLNTGQERLKRRGEMRTVEEKAEGRGEGRWPHLAPLYSLKMGPVGPSPPTLPEEKRGVEMRRPERRRKNRRGVEPRGKIR